jgi:hydroxymethylbilane synthase
VASLLETDIEFVIVDTSGDREQHEPIWSMGGKGVFVKEVQAAVLEGRADMAVHSAKDLPSQTFDGLVLAAVPERGDPRDALVGCALVDLPPGARVATGSVRRRAQLADLRPDLTFEGLRGNIPTRLAKAANFDAIVVAAVALERLDVTDRLADLLATSVMLPQVGQGALAVECRRDDDATRTALAAVEHPDSRRAVDAERAFLAELGGDCDLPAGAYATTGAGDGAGLRLEGLLASLDGRIILRHRAEGAEPEKLGRDVALHLLDQAGGRLLLNGR